MKGLNWNRSRFRTQGRSTESVRGADVPREFQRPRKPAPSKAQQRAEAEKALDEFRARRASFPTAVRKVDGDDDLPF